MEKIFLKIDKKDCMGCHACEVACKQENELPVGPRIIRVIEGISDYTPIYCHQCAKAPCIDACPSSAISKNGNGIVLVDNDTCIGCRECLDACPFGAMQFEEEKETAVKCDVCYSRLAKGKNTACMSVCPTGCISLGGKQSIAAVFER